jgi:hypothetical protein
VSDGRSIAMKWVRFSKFGMAGTHEVGGETLECIRERS